MYKPTRLEVYLLLEGPIKLLTYFFADDTLIFCLAEKQEANIPKDLIRKYEESSLQRINLLKSK